MLNKIKVLFSAALLACMAGYAQAEVLLIENATILTLAAGEDQAYSGYILFDDNKILAVGAGAFSDSKTKIDQSIDGSGKIVMPGFVSGHNHLWQSAFRGIAADKELYGWLEKLHFTYGNSFSDGDFYAFTLHGALDQLAKGITTSYNHSQRLNASEAQYMESLQAELDAGQHFIFSYNTNLHQDDKAIRNDVKALVDKGKELVGHSAMLGVSLHSTGIYAGEDKLKLEMELREKYHLTAQIHYLEEYNRRFIDRKKWPMLMSTNAVADGVSFAHFIQTTDQILMDTAKRGGAMIWNPLSNGRLASGLSDIPKYRAMGVAVGMGVDGAASADIADPFENMRMGMYALRMQEHNANVMLPIEILRLHTLNTAEVLKVDDQVGSLEVGKQADILVIDTKTPLTGAIFDVPAHLVFACNSANISQIYVAGKLMVEDGEVLGQDLPALAEEVATRVERIRTAAGK
ncbi:amidohydrolase family protein [Halioxenophilus sp. WMMB6]|uniref:amidohydrolase family protein n=1 Tax=Halioxenophilus sp. WMMB6 TaxID=3073815 RepID=UPI00295E9F0D|nr:amidohydrolase family protein [Halioxenophilus sp. WMMB6]